MNMFFDFLALGNLVGVAYLYGKHREKERIIQVFKDFVTKKEDRDLGVWK